MQLFLLDGLWIPQSGIHLNRDIEACNKRIRDFLKT
jgi:hypothetical protein